MPRLDAQSIQKKHRASRFYLCGIMVVSRAAGLTNAAFGYHLGGDAAASRGRVATRGSRGCSIRCQTASWEMTPGVHATATSTSIASCGTRTTGARYSTRLTGAAGCVRPIDRSVRRSRPSASGRRRPSGDGYFAGAALRSVSAPPLLSAVKSIFSPTLSRSSIAGSFT